MNIRNALVLTTAVAAALTVSACSQSPNQSWTADRATSVCTDRQGRRVDDDLCDRRGGGGGAYGFMYLNRGSTVPQYGRPVYGGTRTATAGTSYATSKAVSVSRGGFGGSARASSAS